MQITTNRRKPGAKRRFRAHTTVKAAGSPVSVRVFDRAGNASRWMRAGQ